ncbi:MAG: hypothetical protein AB8I08_03150 [Sandaracinaceae bacterium]
MRATTLFGTVLCACLFSLPRPGSAQEMSASDRQAALTRVRVMVDCVERENAALQRINRLIRDSERQRDQARDARVRGDAEASLEALIAQAADLQRRASECFAGDALPTPGTRVIRQAPPPDPAADSVAGTGGTVREVERDTALSGNVRVVVAEQVDGEGRLDPSTVQRAFHATAPRIERCYERWLNRGSLTAHQLDVVFTLRSASARRVTIERSDFGDAAMDRCVTAAVSRLRASRAPSGGPATYSYRLRFGR